MNLIETLPLVDALTSTNIDQTYPRWNASSAYQIGERVLVESARTHYEAVRTNTGEDPPFSTFDAEGNPTGAWLAIGASNERKAFDGKISDPAIHSGNLQYVFSSPGQVTGIAVLAALCVQVTVIIEDSPGNVIYSETKPVVDVTRITDWTTYLRWEPTFDSDLLFLDLPAQLGNRITIIFEGDNVQVGQIAMGKVHNLGTTEAGTTIGFEDFSRKDRDIFGNATLIERDYADTVDFHFRISFDDVTRVKRLVALNRARPSIWFADEECENLATTIYGWPAGNGLRIPLSAAGYHAATLEIEGLT